MCKKSLSVLFVIFAVAIVSGCQSTQKNQLDQALTDTRDVYWKHEQTQYFIDVEGDFARNHFIYRLGVNKGILGYDLKITEAEFNELKSLFYMIDVISRAKKVQAERTFPKTANPELDEKVLPQLEKRALAIIEQAHDRRFKK